MHVVDSHTHIDFDDFTLDRDSVIQRAINTDIRDIIVSATTAERWPLIKSVCDNYPDTCHPAYGLHPMFMSSHQKDSDFGVQLEIANELELPVIIHTRKSLDLVLKYLRRYKKLRGLIHSFSGSEQQAKQLIDLGFYLSFGGPITYSRATRLHKLIKMLPLEKILVETDSPDQPASIHYKQRNEPAFIHEVIEKIAELKQVDSDIVKQITTLNAIALFKFKS